MKKLKAELVAVGTEILLGQIDNSHARYLSTDLAAIGVPVYFHSSVGDNLDRVVATIALAMSRSDIVIVTGGLGPTGDDLTRDAVAKALGLPLTYDEEAFTTFVKPYFDRIGRDAKPIQQSQARRVGTATFLPNLRGTAPGQYLVHQEKHIFLLPGPPLEMRPMYLEQVRPVLMALLGETMITSRVLRFFGIGEADAEHQLADLLRDQTNPTIAPLAGEGEILFRITAKAKDEDSANALIDPVSSEILSRIGQFFYGFEKDSIASVTLDALIKAGKTVSFAESCTGGLATSMLVDFPGASRTLKGSVVAYADEVKAAMIDVSEDELAQYGAVSEQVAKSMAIGTRARFGTDYAVSITGIAGPDGGTEQKPVGLVYFAIADATDCHVFYRLFAGDRAQIRLRSAKVALHALFQRVNENRG